MRHARFPLQALQSVPACAALLRSVNETARSPALAFDMELDSDIAVIARWAVATYGAHAVPIIRRRAAENMMAEEPEAAECWKRVADAANDFLCGRRLN